MAFACAGAVCNAGLAPVDAPVAISLDHKLAWFATVRGRLGTTVVPGWLIYMTGGVAIGEITINGTISDPIGNAVNTAFSNNFTRVGWTIGAGVEAHLFGNWTGSSNTCTSTSDRSRPIRSSHGCADAGVQYARQRQHLRAGVNYKFDREGPIVAKY